MTNGVILTNAGRTLLAKTITGKTLLFTKGIIGDGILGSTDPKTLASLISPKKDLPIRQLNLAQAVGTAEVVLELSNKNLSQGFPLREYGLIAKDPDTGKEILYAYRNTGSEAGFLPADNKVDTINYTLSIVTVIDQAPNVSAVISNANLYVTNTRLEQRVMDIYGQFSDISGFWSFSGNDLERIRPATLAQTRLALMGNSDVGSMNSKLERLEDAVNKLALNLEILQGHDDNYSHFMAEDFNDTSMLDTFEADVLKITTGSNAIDIEDCEGIIPGSNYTLTDGISSENVQVESVIYQNGVQRLILAGNIKNSYVSSSKIFRSNAVFEEGYAQGTSGKKTVLWQPDLNWRGTTESEIFTVNADFSVSNSYLYTATGYATVDDTGLVTLSV